jgi:hypothetical protein
LPYTLVLMKKHEPESALRNLSDKIELQKQVADSKKEWLTTQRKYIQEFDTSFYKIKLVAGKLEEKEGNRLLCGL